MGRGFYRQYQSHRVTVTASDVLVRASAIVMAGWTQHVDHSPDGKQHCARGAIQIAADEFDALDYPLANRASTLLLAYLKREVGRSYTTSLPIGIAEWNDWPGRTAEDVALGMKCAAAEGALTEYLIACCCMRHQGMDRLCPECPVHAAN